MMTEIGDNRGAADQLRTLADTLDADVRSHPDFISELCIQGTYDFPYRAPVYGCLVGLLNHTRSEFGQQFVQRLSREMHAAISDVEMNTVKLQLRLLASLVNAGVVLASSLVSVLNQFLAAADDADDQNGKDCWTWLVLNTLPWCSKLFDRNGDDITSIVERLEGFMSARPSISAFNSALAVIANDETRDAVTLMWNAVQEMREANWPAMGCFEHPADQLQKVLSDMENHEFELDEIPSLNTTFAVIRSPVLRLFDEETSRHDLRAWEATIVRDIIADMIFNNAESHRDAATAIAKLPLSFRPRELVVETLFECIVKASKGTTQVHPLIYFTVLTVDLCALDPKIDAYIGQAVGALFTSAQHLDIQSADIFSEWLALFLSEKQFKWKLWYSDGTGMAYTWLELLAGQEEGSRHHMLLRDFLSRVSRLTYYTKLVPPQGQPSNVIPEGMQRYVTPVSASPPRIPEHLEDGYRKLVRNVQSRMPGPELQAFLEEFMPPEGSPKAERIYLLTSALIQSETKIFSQMVLKFGRYQKLFMEQWSNDLDGKKAVLKAIMDFWGASPQMSVLLVHKLLNAGIVDSTSIVHFLFSEDNSHRLLKSYNFEILTSCLNMVVERTKKFKNEAAAANRALKDVEHLDDCPEKAIAQDKQGRAKDLYDKALRSQKETFLGVFQRFVMALADHLTTCEAEGKDPADMWFACLMARLKQIGRQYHTSIKSFIVTLDTLIFTASGNTDSRINDVFEGFKEL